MKFNSLHTVFVSCALALGFAVTACDDDGGGSKDVCEQAADVLIDDCGLEQTGETGGGEAAACEGDVAAGAQCIVDNPDETCEFFADFTVMNAYTECATAAAGG